MFRDLMPIASDGPRPLAPDLLGYGETSLPPREAVQYRARGGSFEGFAMAPACGRPGCGMAVALHDSAYTTVSVRTSIGARVAAWRRLHREVRQ